MNILELPHTETTIQFRHKVELSCTWKDILEIRRVIYESVARLRYALKHLQRDMITSLAITTTKALLSAGPPLALAPLLSSALPSCTLGRLSARNSAHRLKKHQNRRRRHRRRALLARRRVRLSQSEGRDYAQAGLAGGRTTRTERQRGSAGQVC